MIAHELFTDEAIATRTGTRASRGRAIARRRRSRIARYRSVRLVVLGISAVTLVVVTYLGLLDQITQMNYERASLVAEHERLLDATGRLENHLAQLESRYRLAAFARTLAMKEPAGFAIANVTVDPTPAQPPRGLALLAGWLR